MMKEQRTMSMDEAIAAALSNLSAAGIAHTLVDRCPAPQCEICRPAEFPRAA